MATASTTVAPKTALNALQHVQQITVSLTRYPNGKERRPNKDIEDPFEDVRTNRNDPDFELRMKDVRSMLERAILKEVRKGDAGLIKCFATSDEFEVKKLHGMKIGIWPYQLAIGAKEVWDEL